MSVPYRLVALVAAALVLPVTAQKVPSPKDVFRYELGERYTTHAKIVDYVRSVDAASDRVAVMKYGETYEGRDLLLAVVTSPENHARLSEIRGALAKIADPRLLGAGENAAAIIAELPVFVWLAYNVHGNETSCSEAALSVLYELASGDSDAVKARLEKAVVIIDPCVNPDGRDRYVNWFNSIVGKRGDPNPDSMEHDEPWPGGRFNHYFFDLNRDWAFMTQIETSQRIAEFVKWSPQVYVDYHEMGAESSYFFFPAEKPINVNFPPSTTKWGEIFGRGNAKAFDAKGWDYYTAEDFDLFYPGYGDSWPSLHGAIGMTYEQAGHGRAGITIRRRDDTTLTLLDRLSHHAETSFATIDTAVAEKTALLTDFFEFRRSAIEEGRGGNLREFVLNPGDDVERTARLVDLLIRQGVEVRRAKVGFTIRGVVDAYGKELEEKSFREGVYVVSLAQPTKRLVKTLLEPRTKIQELYFYDVAAWSLPLAFGVESYQSSQAIAVDAEVVAAAQRPEGKVEEGTVGYGWLMRWDTIASVRAAIELTKRGVVVKFANQEFTLDGKVWKRGTIVLPRGGNPADLAQTLADTAKSTGAVFVPARTGMTEKGIDLGSTSVQKFVKPSIALVGGESMGATSFGSARFVIEQLYDVPHSIVAATNIGSVDLERFTAIVFPDGRPDLDKRAIENLTRFVQGGGVVVAFEGSAETFTKEGNGFTSITQKSSDEKKEGEKAERPKRPRTIEQREEEQRKKSAPGSIFRVDLDPAHPLAFGYANEIAVFKEGTSTFDPDGGGLAVGRFVDAPIVSGYLAEESEKAMRNRGFLMTESKGRGQVVLMATDPNFRSGWQGLSRLFLNAVLLLPRH